MVSREEHVGIFTKNQQVQRMLRGIFLLLSPCFAGACAARFPWQKPLKSLFLCKYKVHENKGLLSAGHSAELFT